MFKETWGFDSILTKIRSGEIKSRLLKVGSGIEPAKFTAAQEEKIFRILENLWGFQADKVTRARVLESLSISDLPSGFLNDVDGSLQRWIETELKPSFLSVMVFAADGNDQIFGMVDEINQTVGANMLFSVSTDRINDYIRQHGAELAVQLSETQRNALKTMLNDAIANNWTTNQTYEMMRHSITLTDQEAKWLSNYYTRTLDEQLKYFRSFDPPLKESEIISRAKAVTDRRTAIKKKYYQKNRARRITETELSRAKHAGEIEAHQQALDNGVISEALKQWDKQNYSDNWESSNLYNGKRIPIGESFSQFGIPGKTTMLNFQHPGEISDKCRLVYYCRK